jgi:hypothetical protein
MRFCPWIMRFTRTSSGRPRHYESAPTVSWNCLVRIANESTIIRTQPALGIRVPELLEKFMST